jgi:protein SFI1
MDFQPFASSSLSRTLNGDAVASITAEVARTSTAPIAEFKDLTSQDVKIIDAVIQRAAPSATTFLAIFKAYNDILLEHGLDPHEVTYYGKLLKLGTLKGQTWGDKWATVKRRYGYVDRGQSSNVSLTQPTYPLRPTVSTLASVDTRDDDVFTTYSRNEDDTEYLASEADTDIDGNHYHLAPRPSSSIPTNSLGLDIDSTHHTPVIESRFSSKPPPGRRRPDTRVSASSEDGRTAPTLPSYGAAVRDTALLTSPRPPIKRDALLASPAFTASAARRAVAKARECRGSVVNEDQAWNNIRMAQDEKEADRFRDERLVERCWDIWRQGLQWVHVRVAIRQPLPVAQPN